MFEPIYFGLDRWIFVITAGYCICYEKHEWPNAAALLEAWNLA